MHAIEFVLKDSRYDKCISGCPFGEGCHFLHYVPGGIKAITQMTGNNPAHAAPPRNSVLPPSFPDGSSPPAVKSRLCNKYNSTKGCKFGDKRFQRYGIRPVSRLVAADYFAAGYFVWAVLITNLARIGYEEKNLYMAAYDWRLSFQNNVVAEGAKAAGASRVIGIDIDSKKYETGTTFASGTLSTLRNISYCGCCSIWSRDPHSSIPVGDWSSLERNNLWSRAIHK